MDISDCDLRTIFAESSADFRFDNILQKLKVLNVSNNELERVFLSDLSKMGNLNVFDVSNNHLRCDNDFKSLMKWLGQKKVISLSINFTFKFDGFFLFSSRSNREALVSVKTLN